MSGTYDIFDGHFDRQKGCVTHFASQSVFNTVLNFDGDFDGHWMVTLRVNRP